MSKVELTRVARAVKGAFDRRTLGGIVIGAAVVISAMATAQTSNSGGWFSGLFSTGGSGSNTGDTSLISQQDSVVAASINDEAAKCAEGQPGTIGAAIKSAQAVHQEIASATPQVDSLFDPDADCFGKGLVDLSFAIPSLASILSSVQDAVMKYAQKKVCKAVNRVTGMVNKPINDSIEKINKNGNLTEIVGTKIGEKLDGISPDLGKEYHPDKQDGAYTINTNAFSSGQTTFDTPGTNSPGGSVASTLSNYTSQITSLTQQVASQQVKVNQGTLAVQDATTSYNSCVSGGGDCTPQFGALQTAQQSLARDQSTLITQQQQITQVGVNASSAVVPNRVVQQQPASAAPTTTSSTNSNSTSWWSSLGNIFK